MDGDGKQSQNNRVWQCITSHSFIFTTYKVQQTLLYPTLDFKTVLLSEQSIFSDSSVLDYHHDETFKNPSNWEEYILSAIVTSFVAGDRNWKWKKEHHHHHHHQVVQDTWPSPSSHSATSWGRWATSWSPPAAEQWLPVSSMVTQSAPPSSPPTHHPSVTCSRHVLSARHVVTRVSGGTLARAGSTRCWLVPGILSCSLSQVDQ